MASLFRRKKVDIKDETSQMRMVWGNSKCSPLLLDYEKWEDFETIYTRHQMKLPSCPSKEKLLHQLLYMVSVGWLEQQEVSLETKKSKNPRKKKEILTP